MIEACQKCELPLATCNAMGGCELRDTHGDDHPEWSRPGGLNPARGIVWGLVLSAPMFVAIAWAGGLFA